MELKSAKLAKLLKELAAGVQGITITGDGIRIEDALGMQMPCLREQIVPNLSKALSLRDWPQREACLYALNGQEAELTASIVSAAGSCSFGEASCYEDDGIAVEASVDYMRLALGPDWHDDDREASRELFADVLYCTKGEETGTYAHCNGQDTITLRQAHAVDVTRKGPGLCSAWGGAVPFAPAGWQYTASVSVRDAELAEQLAPLQGRLAGLVLPGDDEILWQGTLTGGYCPMYAEQFGSCFYEILRQHLDGDVLNLLFSRQGLQRVPDAFRWEITREGTAGNGESLPLPVMALRIILDGGEQPTAALREQWDSQYRCTALSETVSCSGQYTYTTTDIRLSYTVEHR